MSKPQFHACGYAGHFAGSDSCHFHLAHQVGGVIVSTVGDYRPNGAGTPQPLGADPYSLFETMVFRADPDSHMSVTDWSEIDSERYSDAESAEAGHYLFCMKWGSESEGR